MTAFPTATPHPSFDNFKRTILRQGPPGPVPLAELYADPATMEMVLGEKFPVDLRSLVGGTGRRNANIDLMAVKKLLDMLVQFCYETGYDYVYMYPGINFPRENFMATQDTAEVTNYASGQRYWQDESTGPIQKWEDFEKYPWPKPEETFYGAVDYVSTALPEGMKVCVNLGGVFENASWLMGFQSFSYALFDQPELIAAIFEKVSEVTLAAIKHCGQNENVGMFFLGDDLGYSNGTLVSPAVLREYVFPRHRQLVDAAHAAGKPILLHSCGNLEKIMDEIIDIGFDAKQSFEDKIMAVEEVYRRWGDRIAILGGLDMDLIARGSVQDVRRRTREILEVCGIAGTGYALGTGNTVANYIPKENYLAMLDEGRRWNREHFGA